MLRLPEESIRSATRAPVPCHPLRQDRAVDSRETYYAYHLGKEVQRYHRRLCDRQHQRPPSRPGMFTAY